MLVGIVIVVASSLLLADDVPPKGSPEQFPQSAKLARDRRADAVLETARAQLRQKDFAAAIVALQELLDGPNAFTGNGASLSSFVEEANRLLREMPVEGRAAYERLHGAEANRLWQAALQSGRADGLREVVARFGETVGGWSALRDLAARHLDRGEWSLAAAASAKLSRHPHSRVTQETGWIARWVLAESRSPHRSREARDCLQRSRKLLEGSIAPVGSTSTNLADWLERQLPAASNPPARKLDEDWRVAMGQAPSQHNVFQHTAGLDGEPATWLHDILADWGQYDIAAMPSTQPLVVGDVVVARFAHPAKVIAVDARRSKLLWEQSLTGSLGPTASDLQRHPGIRTPLIEELQRRWFGDSVRGRLTSDGRRLFLVRDLDDLDLKPGAGSRLRNHLEAWDLATGERHWRIGSSANEPPTGFEGLYFLGPPLVRDGLLFVVAQRELQVGLWVLRASDGQFEWMLPLAETDRLQFKDSGWRHVACPVTWAGGRLICPTGAGCFVAVDPSARSLAWSVRFERDDLFSSTGFITSDRDRPFASRWWESWREVFSRETLDSQILIASPESRSLRAVNAATGEVHWRTKFAEPQFVAASDSAVMVFERARVIGIDPKNGHEIWRTKLPTPDGPGDWIGTNYVCPTDGGWSIIDSATGKVRRSDGNGPVAANVVFSLPRGGANTNQSSDHSRMTPTARPHGNEAATFARVGSRWAVLSPGRFGLFESIADRQEHVADRLRSKPEDAAARTELAEFARQFDDFDQAEELVRPLLNEPATAPNGIGALRQIVLQRLLAKPSEHARLGDELLRMSPTKRHETETRHAIIEAARRSGDSVVALRVALDSIDTEPQSDVIVGHDFNVPGQKPFPEHVENVLHVRRDRWTQGVIADLLEQADAATRTKLDAMLEDRRQVALDSPDAFAPQSLAERLSCLPLGRALRMQLSGRTSSGVGYLKTSLALRAIAHASDRVEAAQAWYRLALLHDFRSEPFDAADCFRELQDRFADVTLPDGHRSAEWLADVLPESSIGRVLANGSPDPWPVRMPNVTPQEEPHDDVYSYLIQVESRDSFWRRMSVFVERQGKKVRFSGGGQRALWELPLPTSSSSFRHDWTTHRGWGLGPLLVLQVGESLFGIQPLDERDETNAKLLWTISAGPYEETGPHQTLPARLGVRLDAYRHLDRHEQPILEVVHASAGLVCYRTRNRLIAIDPATGELLWSRNQLPPQVSITSDGEHVVLRMLATTEIEVRRGFDGKLLSQRTDPASPSVIAFEQGRLRLSSIAGNPAAANNDTRLHGQDLVTGKTLWQRKVRMDSLVLRIDESRCGVVDPSGWLRFVSLTDGQELSKHEVSLPNPLSTLHAFADDLRLYVILAGPVTEPSWLNTQQDRGGYRRPLLNGWVLAFDRRSLKPLWTIPAKNLPFAVDQPNDSPFFVLPYKRPSDDSVDGQHSDGVLHLIDKRNGKEVFFDAGSLNNVYFALDPDPLQQRIDLLTSKRRIRLDYAGE